MNRPMPPATTSSTHDAEALGRLLAELQRHLAEVREQLALDPEGLPSAPFGLVSAPSLARLQPLRVTLLDSLADLGYPTDSSTLRAFIAARYDRSVPSAQFGTIAAQERKSFARRGPTGRPVWLCNGLNHDDFRPVKRIWARSDWPLEWRIITPFSERVQRLHATDVLCELAVREEFGVSPTPLQRLALDLAETLPGIEVNSLDPDFDAYGLAARDLESEIGTEHFRLQEEAADRLEKMPEGVQLFGVEQSRGAR